jgi:2-oxoglutarate/2-oxoacid ferredoxin oxidoreductase subunit alpha
MNLNIRMAGAAGQGVQTAADLLGKACLRSGRHVYSYSDAESRIRGGMNFSQLRISTQPTMSVVDEYDVLVALNASALETYAPGLSGDGILICSQECDHPLSVPFALDSLAKESGSIKVAGTVGLACVCALVGIEPEVVEGVVRERFAASPKISEMNLKAVSAAYQAVGRWEGRELRRVPAGFEASSDRLWIAGHEALSLGAVAGGVRFVAGYPMSPATSILADLAAWASDFGIVVEQAEDELAAINMVAGASYAGARTMTATSGGGFCLMTEGVSLLGMIETPAVIVLGQRPGPSTGLPTRTAQGDLHLVLHAGHGFFPRVVLAPRDVADGFEITARAFDIAERFQVPVFVLTDQLLQDSQAVVPPFDTADLPVPRHLLGKDELDSIDRYQRFAQTGSGVSPLAAPGSSRHVVVVDSDEHDQDGHPIESAEIAKGMAEKRLRKTSHLGLARLLPEPLIEGDPEGRPLIVSWGSTYRTLAEARNVLAKKGREFAHLHLRQLWPLPEELLRRHFDRAASLVVVESNVNGELASLIREVTLKKPDRVLTRLDGRPMNVSELVDRLDTEVVS